ncbi:MAG: GIY-YIG nuclease family protein [Candidatus Caldarchaeum sp.]
MSLAVSRGTYVLAIHLPVSRRLKIGALGYRDLEKGYYVYVGSGRRNLIRRVERHLKKHKPIRWHIDYITSLTETKPIQVAVTNKVGVECILSSKLAAEGKPLSKIGSSDCHCTTHLIFFPSRLSMDKAVQKTFHALKLQTIKINNL